MTSTRISIFLLLLTTFVAIDAQKNLYIQYEWKYMEYQFPSAATRDYAIRTKQYVQGNSFPIDVDVYYGVSPPLIFVTTPRFFEGTPFTLGTISGTNAAGGPLIAPFPNYDWQSGNCSSTSFTNVLRVAVDNNRRLWVLDSGVINDIQVCPAKLVMFDLRSTSIKPFTHVFPSTLYRSGSLFITPVVDVRNGYDSMVYIADVTGFGIIVFDYKNNYSWRAESQSTHLRPLQQYSNFVIGGESFNLMDGVFGLALSPKTYTNRQLFFHALASAAESRIPLNILDTPGYWPQQNPVTNPNQFVQMGLRETTQTTAQAMDANGNLFFGTIYPPGVGCWDSTTLYNNANLRLVARNDLTLQFISGLKIITCPDGSQELWVLSCRFQKIMAGTRKLNEVNYRIQKIPVRDLLDKNYRCSLQTGVAMPRA